MDVGVLAVGAVSFNTRHNSFLQQNFLLTTILLIRTSRDSVARGVFPHGPDTLRLGQNGR